MLDQPPTRARRVSRGILITAFAISLLSLALYLQTIRSQIGPSIDSVELHLGALTSGVVHPPGSPQYVALAEAAAALLPGPDAAYRVNLFSALSMSAALGLIHLLCYRLTYHNVISALATLSLAAAPRMWYLASVAELYALNTFYIAAMLYLLVTWHQTRQFVLYWGAVIVYAMSFGNHTSMLMLLPTFLAAVVFTDHRMLTHPRNLALTLLIVLLAAPQYWAIYQRVTGGALYCNFCPADPQPGWFVRFVTGGDFKSGFFGLAPRLILLRVSESMQQLSIQFMPWGIALGVIGLWEMLRRQSKMGLLLALGLLFEWAFIMGYAIPDWHDFMSPSYVLFTPLIAYGALRLWQDIIPRPAPMLAENRARLLRFVRSIAAPILLVAALGVIALKLAEYYPDINANTQNDWAIKARTLLAEAGSEIWLVMPHPGSTAFVYSYAIPYYAYLDQTPGFSAVPPPEIDSPFGREPLYRSWRSVEPWLQSEAIIENAQSSAPRTLLVIDPSEPRVADWGLLPICLPGEDIIAGYEVVAVRRSGEVVPLIAPDRWAEVARWVVFAGAPATCPR